MPSMAPATHRGDRQVILDFREDVPVAAGLGLVSGGP